MSRPRRLRPTADSAAEKCPWCFGIGYCWVCLGTRRIESKSGAPATCLACSGTGLCPECTRVTLRR